MEEKEQKLEEWVHLWIGEVLPNVIKTRTRQMCAETMGRHILLYIGDVKLVNEYCVNFGGDCDTNAAMAGAMAGAYSGIATVPKEWVETINKVNNIDLSVYVPQLIELAKEWTVAQV